MSTLFEIADELLAFKSALDATDGELTAESEAALDAWYARLSEDRDRKLDAYGALIRQEELLAAARKEEAERLTKRVHIGEALACRLKERLLYFMESQGEKKIDTRRYRFSVCKNGGQVPLSVAIELLPPALTETVIKPNMAAIRTELGDGSNIIPGVTVKDRGKHLRIS